MPDLSDQDRVNVLLAVSELVTNAVVHAATDIEVRVSRLGPRLRVAVRDESPIMPRMLDPAPDGLHGRGLHIVRRLSSSFGVSPVAPTGKVVWATFRVGPGE